MWFSKKKSVAKLEDRQVMLTPNMENNLLMTEVLDKLNGHVYGDGRRARERDQALNSLAYSIRECEHRRELQQIRHLKHEFDTKFLG